MIPSAGQNDDMVAALDSDGKAQWQRLRRQIEWANGFWLGFLFCQSPQVAATIRARVKNLLRFRARAFQVLVPTDPDELGSLLPVLFEPAMATPGLVWVEAVRGDAPEVLADQPGPWTAAWDKLLLLLNERRDALGRHLQGGLTMVAPIAIKPRARVAAPDVWSIRSVVMELPPPPVALPAGNGDGADLESDLRAACRRARHRRRGCSFGRSIHCSAKGEAATGERTGTGSRSRRCGRFSVRLCRGGTGVAVAGRGALTVTSLRHWSHVGEAIQLRCSSGWATPLRFRHCSANWRPAWRYPGALRQETGDLQVSDAAYAESLVNTQAVAADGRRDAADAGRYGSRPVSCG